MSADAQITTLFSQPTPESLASIASLINRQPNTDSILDQVIDRFVLDCSTRRSDIDSFLAPLSSLATQLDPSIVHPGHTPEDPYATTQLRPSKGSGLIAERLSHKLYRFLWPHTSRCRTPDEEYDLELPKQYYVDASLHGTILARAFAAQPVFRPQLWREVEDVFVKGLFSNPDPELRVFVVLSALLLGAGDEIREYLSQGGSRGKGGEWLWYNDERTDPDREWSWLDVVESLRGLPDPEVSQRVPDYVKGSFEKAQLHVGDGSGELKSWSSERLAGEAFGWV